MKFNMNEIKEIKYCDYIEIATLEEVFIYNVVWSSEYGLCLQLDDEPLIKELHIIDSKLVSYYIDKYTVTYEEEIKSVKIDDIRFQRRYQYTILGTLLKCNLDMAKKYNLDQNLAFHTLEYIPGDNQTKNKFTKKRIKEI